MDLAKFNQFTHEYLHHSYFGVSDESADTLVVNLPFVAPSLYPNFTQAIMDYAKANQINLNPNIQFKTRILSHKVKAGITANPGIKNIIAITSGKGGVGKSTVSFNLAIALAKNGARVGLLDADIYGPSLPTLIGEVEFKPEVEDQCFVPLEKYGIKAISFGFLIAKDQPAIWRGAMINKALEQLLNDTKWGELDYLIMDMPPGTGDIHLTMCQKFPITAVVTVTTPQDIALVDVIKSIEMYRKMDIPCLGVVENMATHICSNCGHSEDVFGSDGAQILSSKYSLDILVKLPLDIAIRQASDLGMPIDNVKSQSISDSFNQLAFEVSYRLSKLPKDYSSKLGKLKVV